MITPEKLKWHFNDGKCRKGKASGNDGITYDDLSPSEVWDICRDLADEIHRGAWQPNPPREQIIPKREGTRTLQIRNLFDRVVSATVAAPVWNLLKPMLPQSVTSVHGGVHRALLIIQRAAIERNYFIVGQDDIRHAFDEVTVRDCVTDFSRYITDHTLLSLIGKILWGHSSRSQPLGIAQGDPLSPPAMELRLHHVLDAPDPTGKRVVPLSFRYVDNLVEIGDSVSPVAEALAQDERQLNQASLYLKHQNGPPCDIRQIPVDLLGFRITAVKEQVQIGLAADAFQKLREKLKEAHLRPNPRESARQKIQGWVMSYGPAWGNADMRHAISQIRWALGDSGFSQLLPNQQIKHWIVQAAQQWETKARRATLTNLMGQTDL